MTKYIYVTKYFKSKGIFKAELRYEYEKESQLAKDDYDGRCLFVKWPASVFGVQAHFYLGKDCFRTFEMAVRHCEELRDKEIRSLERRIEKLKATNYFVVKIPE